MTTGNKDEFPLTVRGDGIQTRFLPSLLYHIAEKSNRHYIWGFEEPENCLEHRLATKLANDFLQEYSNNSQIILTSHSPAFISMQDKKCTLYGVTQNLLLQTDVEKIDENNNVIKYDIGLIHLQREYQRGIQEQLEKEIQTNCDYKILLENLKRQTGPLLLVEGKTDKLILDHAWNKLYPGKTCPFSIENCSTVNDHDTSTGGVDTLKAALTSHRNVERQMIGLFDNDIQGKKAFDHMDNNFILDKRDSRQKTHRINNNVVALCLGGIERLSNYENTQTLVIEFYFPENFLKINNRKGGLVFRQLKISSRMEGRTETTTDSTELHCRTIIDGKTNFAQNIVPTLPIDAFEDFKHLFTTIETIFKNMKQEQ